MLNSFHFLRPWWFLALIPAIVIFIIWLRKINLGKNNWSEHCDPHLLSHLLANNEGSAKTSIPILILGIWLISILALAGPTWSMYAQAVYQKNTARIIALDVSQSMNATDIVPSRLQRAKYKVLDLLHDIKEGQTGMLVFSSSAFVVSPLTSDTNTIASMVPILDSNIVPVQGSDIGQALRKSATLLSQAGFTQGQIILVTDSTPSDSALAEASKLAAQGYKTSILAVGTEQGGPVTQQNGGFETDANGNVALTRLDSQALKKLASAGSGDYIAFSNNNSDLEQILDKLDSNKLSEKASKETQNKSLWKDEGHYLVWLAIILAAFIARRGALEKIC